jgi:hypothetical protein
MTKQVTVSSIIFSVRLVRFFKKLPGAVEENWERYFWGIKNPTNIPTRTK